MRASYRMLGTLALSIASVSTVQAEGWSGKVGLGALATSGNSETSTFDFALGLNFDRDIWHNKFIASATQARSEVTDDATGTSSKQTTTERYVVGLRSAVDFSDVDYLFAELKFEKDLFGGVRERMVESVGYGRRLINEEAHKLDFELGAGARQLKAQGDDAERESEVIGRTGLNYLWNLSETSRFAQSLSIESGEENTYTEAFSELKLSVIGSVFCNLGFRVKHNSEVPVETEKTDTISSVSLSYEF